ncbi:Uncharacterised protein [Kluyvera cryocrescens]|uniref:Uncharacterized protein n=1 Tax=Kluyvera cryocrescens TaxID=580 RepID=A0A485AL49_KLUCR|nr:Uncharacterised protein [Kluyvera cryocrescens]
MPQQIELRNIGIRAERPLVHGVSLTLKTRPGSGAGWRQRQWKIAYLCGGAGYFTRRRTANDRGHRRGWPAGLPAPFTRCHHCHHHAKPAQRV